MSQQLYISDLLSCLAYTLPQSNMISYNILEIQARRDIIIFKK